VGKTTEFDEFIKPKLNESLDRNHVMFYSILAYLDTILIIDEKFVKDNLENLLPTYVKEDYKIYYYRWYIIFLANSFSDKLLSIIKDKILCHLTNLRKLNLSGDNDHYNHIISLIANSFGNGYEDSKSLVDSLILNFPEEKKCDFIKRISLVLKNSINKKTTLNHQILLDLLDDEHLQGCGDFLRWIQYSPFDKASTLKLFLKIVTSSVTSSEIDISKRFNYLLLDDIIFDFKDYIIVNENNILLAILTSLQKLIRQRLYFDKTKIYESLVIIRQKVRNSELFNRIVEILLNAGYLEFLALKI
jgi:hypothetical protein